VRDHHCLHVHGQDTAAWCTDCALDWAWFHRTCGDHVTWEAAMAAYQRCVEEATDEPISPPAPQPVEIKVAPGLSVIMPGWHDAYEAAQRTCRN
jgi:hypothetical protein